MPLDFNATLKDLLSKLDTGPSIVIDSIPPSWSASDSLYTPYTPYTSKGDIYDGVFTKDSHVVTSPISYAQHYVLAFLNDDGSVDSVYCHQFSCTNIDGTENEDILPKDILNAWNARHLHTLLFTLGTRASGAIHKISKWGIESLASVSGDEEFSYMVDHFETTDEFWKTKTYGFNNCVYMYDGKEWTTGTFIDMTPFMAI